MRYINTLEAENAELKAQLKEARDTVVSIRQYLDSNKFKGTTNDYVQVSTDIEPKLLQLQSMLLA